MINKVYALTDDEFKDLILNSINISEVLFKLGYSVEGNSWGFSEVKKRMLDLGLTSYDFKGKSVLREETDRVKVTKENLLKENSNHKRIVLRRFILHNNLLEYKCAICGITKWNGKTLSLELDHINGINNDNRLENLRFLCPNCHSQTSTFGSKNYKGTESIFDIPEEVEEKIVECYRKVGNIRKVSKVLGMKEIVVKRVVCKKSLSKTNQMFVIRYDLNMNEIARYGSINEMCRSLIENKEVRTNSIHTCRNTFNRNIVKQSKAIWLNSYWKIMDAHGIINNP